MKYAWNFRFRDDSLQLTHRGLQRAKTSYRSWYTYLAGEFYWKFPLILSYFNTKIWRATKNLNGIFPQKCVNNFGVLSKYFFCHYFVVKPQRCVFCAKSHHKCSRGIVATNYRINKYALIQLRHLHISIVLNKAFYYAIFRIYFFAN